SGLHSSDSVPVRGEPTRQDRTAHRKRNRGLGGSGRRYGPTTELPHESPCVPSISVYSHRDGRANGVPPAVPRADDSGSFPRSAKRAGKPAGPRRLEPGPDHRTDGDQPVLLPGQDVSELGLPQTLRQALSRVARRDEARREDHRTDSLPGGGAGDRSL